MNIVVRELVLLVFCKRGGGIIMLLFVEVMDNVCKCIILNYFLFVDLEFFFVLFLLFYLFCDF